MARVRDIGISDAAFLAGADLSASANRYKFVMLSTSADKVVTGNGASGRAPIGVLQNSPCANEEAAVRMLGFTKLIVDCGTCDMAIGNFITCASDGQGEKQTAASAAVHAIAMEAVTGGSALIEAFLIPFGLTNATT